MDSEGQQQSEEPQRSAEQAAAAAMVAQARKDGLELTGPGGLLKLFTKSVLETGAERGEVLSIWVMRRTG